MPTGHRLSIAGKGLAGNHYRVALDGAELLLTKLVLEMDAQGINRATITVLVGAIDCDVEVEEVADK